MGSFFNVSQSKQKGYIIPLLLFGMAILFSGIGLLVYYQYYRAHPQTVVSATPIPAVATQITDFASCVAAGNAVQESYPRKCNAEGKSFTEAVGQVESSASGQLDTTNWKIYENNEKEYVFKYPPEFIINMNGSNVVIESPTHPLAMFIFSSSNLGLPLDDMYQSNELKTVTKQDVIISGVRAVEYIISYKERSTPSIVTATEWNDKIYMMQLNDISQKEVYLQLISTFNFYNK